MLLILSGILLNLFTPSLNRFLPILQTYGHELVITFQSLTLCCTAVHSHYIADLWLSLGCSHNTKRSYRFIYFTSFTVFAAKKNRNHKICRALLFLVIYRLLHTHVNLLHSYRMQYMGVWIVVYHYTVQQKIKGFQ